MIGMLQGTVAFLTQSFVLVNVHGVGYKVLAPSRFLANKKPGEDIVLYTHTHVREDVLELYGFENIADLNVFELLIGVSGIGCKTALGVFGNGSRSEIMEAIFRADIDFFSGVPRLGRKNAQKIIIELKGKLGSDVTVDLGNDSGGDVVEALETFGYSRAEAQKAYREVKEKGTTPEEKIKLALKYLGK